MKLRSLAPSVWRLGGVLALELMVSLLGFMTALYLNGTEERTRKKHADEILRKQLYEEQRSNYISLLHSIRALDVFNDSLSKHLYDNRTVTSINVFRVQSDWEFWEKDSTYFIKINCFRFHNDVVYTKFTLSPDLSDLFSEFYWIAKKIEQINALRSTIESFYVMHGASSRPEHKQQLKTYLDDYYLLMTQLLGGLIPKSGYSDIEFDFGNQFETEMEEAVNNCKCINSKMFK